MINNNRLDLFQPVFNTYKIFHKRNNVQESLILSFMISQNRI